MRTYKGCLVHPSSHLAELMALADKTGKSEDHKAVSAHYAKLDHTFRQQCGLGTRPLEPWSIGRS